MYDKKCTVFTCVLCVLSLPLCSSMSLLYLILSKYFPRHRNKWTCNLKLCSLTLHITHKTRIWDDFFRICNLTSSNRKGWVLLNWQGISDTTKCMWRVSEQENISFPKAEIAFGFPQHKKLKLLLPWLCIFITKVWLAREIYKHINLIWGVEYKENNFFITSINWELFQRISIK